MITREEERELVIRAQAGDGDALGELFDAHKRFLYKEARRRARTEEDVDDYFQEAAVGVMQALNTFDPNRGIRFLTYCGQKATWSVMAAAESNSLIRVASGAFNKNASEELLRAGERARAVTSLSNKLDSEDREFIDSLADDSAPAPDLIAGDTEEIGRLTNAISLLPDRWREIVELRMGGATLSDVGQTLGITRERVRQLESKAHAFLRKSMESRDVFSVKPKFSRWSPAEIAFVEKHFFDGTLVDLAKKIQRPYGSLIVVARRLKLRRPKFIWTPERDEMLRGVRSQDYGAWRRAADILGCSPSAVRCRVTRLGIQKQKVSQTSRERIIALHATGASNKAIAAACGVVPETIRVALRELGLETNPRDLSAQREWARNRRGDSARSRVASKQKAATLGYPDLQCSEAVLMVALGRIGTGTVYDLLPVCKAIVAEHGWKKGASKIMCWVGAKKLCEMGLIERVSGGGNTPAVYRPNPPSPHPSPVRAVDSQ